MGGSAPLLRSTHCRNLGSSTRQLGDPRSRLQWEAVMAPNNRDIEYLRRREADSRRMADAADEPHAAVIHRRMAQHYADTAATVEDGALKPVN